MPVSSLDPEPRSPDKYQIILKVMQRDVEVDVPTKAWNPMVVGVRMNFWKNGMIFEKNARVAGKN